MKITLSILIFLFVNFSFSQINYCDNCGKFGNDSTEFYGTVSEIRTKIFKGSPVYEDLTDEDKERLLEETTTTTYNEFGKVVKHTISEWLNGFEVSTKSFEFTFDDKENIISLINREGPIEHKETFKYFDNQIVHYIYKDDGIEADRIVKYTLNGKGLVTNRAEFFGNGNLYKEESTKYDLKGNETFNDSYGVKTTTLNKYDNKGKVTSKTSKNNYNKGTIINYNYDTNGNIIEQKLYKLDGKLILKDLFEYENGKLVKHTEYYYTNNKVYSTEIVTYKFDENGNWINKQTSRNGIINSNFDREIEYRN